MFFNCCRRNCCCRQKNECDKHEKNYCDVKNKYDYNMCDNNYKHNKCEKEKDEKKCCAIKYCWTEKSNGYNKPCNHKPYFYDEQSNYCNCNHLGSFNQYDSNFNTPHFNSQYNNYSYDDYDLND